MTLVGKVWIHGARFLDREPAYGPLLCISNSTQQLVTTLNLYSFSVFFFLFLMVDCGLKQRKLGKMHIEYPLLVHFIITVLQTINSSVLRAIVNIALGCFLFAYVYLNSLH